MQRAAQEFRGLHYDLARGNYDSLASLRDLVTFTADCGLNELVFYMEDLWRYRRHPDLANAHAYDPAALGELARFAAARGVDLIPSFTTLGHSHHILQKPGYRHLAFPGDGGDFDVLNPAVYRLFAELFDEVLPHFESPYVFINGDEMNLSQLTPAARELARARGLGALYGRGMAAFAQLILERGRRPLMWHDMLLHHPESMPLLPRETVVVYWFYDSQPTYPAIDFFTDAGFDVVAAPGLLRHGHVPDYARALPNIAGQARAAAAAAAAPAAAGSGRCLGTLTTVWERVRWPHAALAVYATGQWTGACDVAVDPVLERFGPAVFGLESAGLGRAWTDASYHYGQLTLIRAAAAHASGAAAARELDALDREVRERLGAAVARMQQGPARVRRELHGEVLGLAREMDAAERRPAPAAKAPEPPELYAPELLRSGAAGCGLVRGETRHGHELCVVSNGVLAVAMLPQFAATMIEWVLLGTPQHSYVVSNYERWAETPRTPGDPGLTSPWGAGRLGGWHETLFFNARCNPTSLQGCPFTVRERECGPDRIVVECRGGNGIADLCRTVRLDRDRPELHITSTATNRYGACALALQPNVAHTLPRACVPLLQLEEADEDGGRWQRRLIDHDGTLVFTPRGNRVRIVSTLTGAALALAFDPQETGRILTDIGPESFTLEPLGPPAPSARGDSVSMTLHYRLAQPE